MIRLVSSVRSLFTFACNEDIGNYAYAVSADPMRILFPQCNLPPGPGGQLVEKLMF